jgi:hypothetical protein
MENCYRFDPVGGLLSRKVTLPGAMESISISCLGDEEIIDSKKGVIYMPSKPNIATPIHIQLHEVVVYCPSRTTMEQRMIKHVGITLKNAIDVRIISRKIKIGMK